MAETIELVGMTAPSITKILRDSRNESSPDSIVDITGYTIRLIVKQNTDIPDSRAHFTLDATLVTPTGGVYRFDFTTRHTGLPPGTYPGEIRWWPGSTSSPAKDAVPVDFIITEPLDLQT